MTAVSHIKVKRYQQGQISETEDLVALEEPLEVRLGYGVASDRQQERLAVTMRTPGNDFELGLGMLYGEGIISSRKEVESVHYCETVKPEEKENVIRIELSEGVEVDWKKIQRHIYSHAACGVCGKTSIDAVLQDCQPVDSEDIVLDPLVISTLPARLKERQLVFKHTGGLHAVGLFDINGNLLEIREDVGRHNALDKLVGAMLEKKQIPLSKRILLLSGRISYELVQKSARAGIPVVCAVGAPSSLAVSLAKDAGIKLIGFVKEDYYNVY